jgi:sugar transferase (PEP-CTERM/EpsH1 system associated)
MHILWLKTELLHPVDKGGRIRTYQMLRAIAREHRVTYLTLDDGGAAPDALALAREYARDVVRVPFDPPARGSARFYLDLARNTASSLPYAVGKYRSRAFEAEIARLAGSGGASDGDAVDVVVCDFLAPAVNLPGTLPVPIVLFQHNVEAEIWRRHAAVASNPIAKRYFAEQFRRMARFEGESCRRVAHVVAVSDQDADHFRTRYGATGVSAVATGVDTEYFTSTGTRTPTGPELVFTGSMDWMPNEDGILWFAREILPRLRARVPDATVTVVGRNPTAALKALAGEGTGIRITGRVDDVRPYMEQARVFVVPLRVGGGTRLKIYEAMAMGLPVVSTTIGAEGLPVRDGEHLVIGDTPDAFADACAALLGDAPRAAAVGGAARRLVREHFDWGRIARDFVQTCDTVLTRADRPPRRTPAAR